MSVLEDLIVENNRTYSPELRAARAQPRDEQATADLKGDSDRMAALADLADVEPERIVDAAVRGVHVSFVVADEVDANGVATGAVSNGYFLLADLDAKSVKAKARARERRGTTARASTDPAPSGGTATVPTVARDGLKPPPAGVPGNIDELNVSDVTALLKEPPVGVDPRAVAEYERGREKPRDGVLKVAESLGLFDTPAPTTPPPPAEEPGERDASQLGQDPPPDERSPSA